ncbi:MAG: hypothetical protein ABI824_07540 [Acidobacteriota bacterium]
MSPPKLCATIPINPKEFLGEEYKRRINDAYHQGEGIRLSAEAAVESRGLDPQSIEACHLLNQARMESAQVYLTVINGAYGNTAPNRQIFTEWMRDEIEDAFSSLPLLATQRLLLEHTFLSPLEQCKASAVDPAKPFLEAVESRVRDKSAPLTKERNDEYDKIKSRKDLAGNCRGRAYWRLQIYESCTQRRALLMADVYIEVAKEFGCVEMLSLIRLEHLRRKIQTSIQMEGASIKQINKQDCHAAGDLPLNDRELDQTVWAAQSVIMSLVYSRLQVIISDLAARAALDAPPAINNHAALANVTTKDMPPPHPPSHLGTQIDHLAERLDIKHDDLALRMQMNRSTYYAVKAGGGGRKAKAKVKEFIKKNLLDKIGPKAD